MKNYPRQDKTIPKLPPTRHGYPKITPGKTIPKLPQTRLYKTNQENPHWTYTYNAIHTHACIPTFRAGLKWGSVLSSFETLSTPSVCWNSISSVTVQVVSLEGKTAEVLSPEDWFSCGVVSSWAMVTPLLLGSRVSEVCVFASSCSTSESRSRVTRFITSGTLLSEFVSESGRTEEQRPVLLKLKWKCSRYKADCVML